MAQEYLSKSIIYRCRGPRRKPFLVRRCARCDAGSHKNLQPTGYHDYNTYPHQHHINTNAMPSTS